MNLDISQINKATTITTMIMPDQTPALKIPPMTSQLVKKVVDKATSANMLNLFISFSFID